jgi:potassium-transporting ATPase KdpC subunit
MKTYFLPAIKITLLTMVLFGVLFPLFIVGIAKVSAPNEGNGEIITLKGKTIGFELIGQSFTSEKYFNSRPSAVGYNAAATGGSNKGPSNPEYLRVVEERISDFLEKNPTVNKDQIPVDLITASGGGLDPHISKQAAQIQVDRIAQNRNIPKEELNKLIEDNFRMTSEGIGPPRVHVLHLNIALDQLRKK